MAALLRAREFRSSTRLSLWAAGALVVLAVPSVTAQECACGAPCDLLLESIVDDAEVVTACNVVTIIGAEIQSSGDLEILAGQSVSIFSGFRVTGDGELAVAVDPLLVCDPATDADGDGVDECLDCDETDENNWDSCASCVDLDNDSAWTGCDAYVTLIGPDCDDGNVDRKPGVVEICNEIDDNCDGLVDECLVCAVAGPSGLPTGGAIP